MPNKKNVLLNELRNINASLKKIEAHLDNEKENIAKASYETFIKVFEHDRQKSQKIEDKANKIVNFLVSLFTIYIALFIWLYKSKELIMTVLISPEIVHNTLMVLISISGLLLLFSIEKAFKVQWHKQEMNPVASFEMYHNIKMDSSCTTEKIYDHYAKGYSKIAEHRIESNKERGEKLGVAFNWARISIIVNLIVAILILIATTN
ncbi:hypothetical protein GNP61_05360 [Aliivibrio fischeri]|uniref:hypothetical protein n=1 Tax=Aliivibrio fischeri TaxID=668 RepID=UPI0012DAA19E|nr:hypothetical protein [Aliivibrio fischeri]MUK40984.1 hypothetical protein [Aliivibrio fischeri]